MRTRRGKLTKGHLQPYKPASIASPQAFAEPDQVEHADIAIEIGHLPPTDTIEAKGRGRECNGDVAEYGINRLKVMESFQDSNLDVCVRNMDEACGRWSGKIRNQRRNVHEQKGEDTQDEEDGGRQSPTQS